MDQRMKRRLAPCARASAARRFRFLLLPVLFLATFFSFGAARAQSSICAEVKIQIDQKVSLERQAFEAILKIHNGLEGVPVENLDVNITFLDAQGNAVVGSSDPNNTSASFFLSVGLLVGVNDVDGSGTVAPMTDAQAHWLIIPAPHSGGTLPQGALYQVGATVTYRMAGESKSVDVIPETITVRPQPMLDLDYFLPGEVYSEDPQVPGTEATVPFTLGVRVANSGAGAASHLTIESAQPVIKENIQGLLIGFHIDGGYVDDAPAQPSLLLDFGDIAPGASRIGRWVMTTTLSGKFFEFTADYTHADELGGALTSLIGTLDTHLLTHDVLVDLAGRDSVRDFLAQAATTSQDTDPYFVYESDGLDSPVAQRFDAVFTGSKLRFAPGAPGELVYARSQIGSADPAAILSATRNGHTIPPGNAWFSKRRDGTGNTWVYFINLFEANTSGCGSTCEYDLTYDNAPSLASLSGLVYEDVNGNGVRDAGEAGIGGVAITLGGAASPLPLQSLADGTFQFGGLAAGTYSLSVAAVDGHYDGQGTIGNANGTSSGATISGIVLDSATQASGYAFAKVPQPTQLHADLAITGFAASTSTPRAEQTFTLTLQVANIGPDPAAADAGIVLPSSVELVAANPSIGTFDPSTRHWAIGNLAAAATASLAVQVRAHAEGDLSIAASISTADVAVLDPVTTNNSASVSLHVDPSTAVRVTPSFSGGTRILGFVTCPTRLSAITCRADRATKLDTFLGARSVEHVVASDPAVFRDELRSGHWNAYWIDYGLSDLDATTIAELGLAVLRGDSLIVDGAHGTGAAPIDAWTGATYSAVHGSSGAEVVTFVANPYLFFQNISVTGAKYAYHASTATLVAKYPDNSPAILFNTYGSGRVLLFAYDALDSMADNSAYTPLFGQVLTALEPDLPTTRTSDSYASVGLHLENLGDAVNVKEALAVPAGARIVAATPVPSSLVPARAEWLRNLAQASTFDAAIALRTPASGSLPIVVDVTRVGGDNANLAHEELPLAVQATATRISSLASEITALPVVGATDTTLRTNAYAAVIAAQTAHDKGSRGGAITKLLPAETALAQIVSADTHAVRADLAWALQGLEREWYAGLSSCDAALTTPIVDSGDSFSPFGADAGLYMHQVNPGGFEWRLGFDTQSTTDSVGTTTAMTGNTAYTWSLIYDGAGNATMSVNLGTSILVHQTYTAANIGKALATANALELYVESLTGTGTASITATASYLDGATVSNTIAASSGTTTPSASASLYYYGESMKNGFTLSGTLSETPARAIGSGTTPPPRLSFRVNAGTVSCELASR